MVYGEIIRQGQLFLLAAAGCAAVICRQRVMRLFRPIPRVYDPKNRQSRFERLATAPLYLLVMLALAARALVLSSGIRTAFEAHALELVDAVSGDPRKVTALTQALERIFDDALSEYSRELEITVDMADMPRQEGERHVADAAD